jgi:hypothetical protein
MKITGGTKTRRQEIMVSTSQSAEISESNFATETLTSVVERVKFTLSKITLKIKRF